MKVYKSFSGDIRGSVKVEFGLTPKDIANAVILSDEYLFFEEEFFEDKVTQKEVMEILQKEMYEYGTSRVHWDDKVMDGYGYDMGIDEFERLQEKVIDKLYKIFPRLKDSYMRNKS